MIENQGTALSPDMKRVSNIYPINSDSVRQAASICHGLQILMLMEIMIYLFPLLYDPTVPQSLMFFKNKGTPQSADHELITLDYLKTFDVGNNSSPVFIDIDNDDDLDLFIGSLKNPTGSINFLENTGSASKPSFYFGDSSFLI